jgi:DNA polymerase-3 subunit alpha
MRRALAEALPDALGHGQNAQKDRRAGQMGLFSIEPETTAAPIPRLSNAEWSEAEMLSKEKAVLGFYITKHPLTKFETLLESCATTPIGELEKYQDGTDVILGGMVTNLRTLVSRTGRNAGKNIGIVTLEDLSGKVEGIVFSDQLATHRALLVPDAVLFLTGQVDRKRESPALRVSDVVPVDRAIESFARTMLIDVDDHTPVEKLITLFRAHRGECRVYFNVSTLDGSVAQIECNPLLRVSCKPDFLAAVGALIPPDSWKLLGGKRKIIPVEAKSAPTLLSAAV